MTEAGPRGARRQAILVGMGVHAGFADLDDPLRRPRAVSGTESPKGPIATDAGSVPRCRADAGLWLGAGPVPRRCADSLADHGFATYQAPTSEGCAMSHAATNWAIQQRGLKLTTKIVLWHLW